MSIAHKTQVVSANNTIIAENQQKVYKAGQKSEYDKHWDTVQNYGEPTSYVYAFSYGHYTDENYNPKYDLLSSNGSTSLQNAFYSAIRITDIKVSIIANGGNMSAMFYNCQMLISIPRFVINVDVTNFSNAFGNCRALENIIISGEGRIACDINVQWSTKLTHDSLMSIINALSTTTIGLTVTLSKKAVNNAFETSEGAGDGSTSQEWIDLIATRSNWTISLV